MPWFKVDDALAMHVKSFTAGNKALGLWVRAGSWSMDQLTDGHIPQGVVSALGGEWDDTAALVNAGLWHQVEGGFQFHDWAEYQPTRESILAEREAAAERMRRVRANKQANDSRTFGRSSASPVPVPSPDSSTYVKESSYVGNRARDSDADKSARNTLAGLGISADRLMTHIAQHIHLDLSPSAALQVALDRLDKGNDVKKPQAYVLGCITKSPAEVEQFIHESGIA